MTTTLTHAQTQSRLKNMMKCIDTLVAQRMKSALDIFNHGVEKGFCIWDECVDDIKVNPFHVVCALYYKHSQEPASPRRDQILKSLDDMAQALIDKNVNIFAPALQEIERTTCMGKTIYRKTEGKTVIQLFDVLPPSVLKKVSEVDCNWISTVYDQCTYYSETKRRKVKQENRNRFKANRNTSPELADFALQPGRFVDEVFA